MCAQFPHSPDPFPFSTSPGLNAKDMDSIYRSLLAVFEVLQQHYPQRLRQLYFVSAPLLFWGVWRLLSAFVDPVTREKIVFVSGAGRGRETLEGCIPLEALPSKYGGRSPLIPVLEGIALHQSGQPAPPVPAPEAPEAAKGVDQPLTPRAILRLAVSQPHLRARASQLHQQMRLPLGVRPLLAIVAILLAFHAVLYWTWIRHVWQLESLTGVGSSHSSLLLV